MNRKKTNRILFILIGMTCTGAQAENLKSGKILMDFTKKIPARQIKSEHAEVKPSSEGLHIHIDADAEGVVSFVPEDTYWDITQWVFLTVELENTGTKETRFDTYLQGDNPHMKKKGKKGFSDWHIGWVKAGETRSYHCVSPRHEGTSTDYEHVDQFPGMRGIPNGIILNSWSGIDASRIRTLKLKFPAAKYKRQILVKSIRATRPAVSEMYAKDPQGFFPFINTYGQYKHATWPGKITADEQFAAAIEKEERDQIAHPGSMEWNRFGGFKNGPKLTATGHFRVEKVGERWWIVDPEGRLFWSTGVNGAAKLTVSTPLKGRNHFFEKIPKMKEPFGQFHDKGSYNFGSANLYRKYGENCDSTYVLTALNRMKSWGLNTLGGWGFDELSNYPEKVRLPYTAIISATTPEISEKFPDVFDPRWKASVHTKLNEKAERVKNDPYFLGMFINNEIHWGAPTGLAKKTLEHDASCAGKQAYLTRLKKRLVSIETFNQKTKSAFSSWNQLLETRVKDTVDIEALREINIEHYTVMCETYFKVTSDAMKELLPNKMYIGCRWHGNTGNQYNMPIAARYVDIFSFNIYRNEVDGFSSLNIKVDKPFIVSEFNFGALDRGKFFTGLGYASDQRNRGEKYRHYVNGAMRNKRCVGAHWFTWSNSTTAGKGNGENANCGLVSATDQIYYELINDIRKTTYTMYDRMTRE